MILFFFAEAISSILRAKASFILTIASLSISVFLILSSVIAIQASGYLENRVKEIVKVNLFLKEGISDQDLHKIEDELRSKSYVSGVSYISKDEAAKLFVQQTGEDFREILDYNPLPASFVISLKNEYTRNDSLDLILSELAGIKWTDEVVFQNRFIYRILQIIDSVKNYLFMITVLVIFIAVYLVYTTVNLIIKSKIKEFETMKLVGAKLSAIKIPVMLNGLLAGILASAVCISVYYLLTGYFASFGSLVRLLADNWFSHLMILIFTGPIFGSFITFLTLRKITLKI